MKEPKIEKIYSRRSKIFYGNKEKIIKIAVVCLIALLIVSLSLKSIDPIIDTRCREIAKSISSEFAGQEVKKVAGKYAYEDLSIVEKDDQNNIKMIKINTGLANQIMADIATGVQKSLDECDEDTFSIRLGSFTGSKILSGRGPKVKIRIQTSRKCTNGN